MRNHECNFVELNTLALTNAMIAYASESEAVPWTYKIGLEPGRRALFLAFQPRQVPPFIALFFTGV